MRLEAEDLGLGEGYMRSGAGDIRLQDGYIRLGAGYRGLVEGYIRDWEKVMCYWDLDMVVLDWERGIRIWGCSSLVFFLIMDDIDKV